MRIFGVDYCIGRGPTGRTSPFVARGLTGQDPMLLLSFVGRGNSSPSSLVMTVVCVPPSEVVPMLFGSVTTSFDVGIDVIWTLSFSSN